MLNLNATTAAAAYATLPAAAATVVVPATVQASIAAAYAAPAAPAGKHAARAANAHKYATVGHATVAAAKAAYTLTALGAATAAANGAGKSGNPTVMGCVAVAAAHVVAKGRPLTCANIVAAMQALPAMRAAIAASRAGAKYAANGHYCNAWLAGYVRGAARSPHSLLATVTG